jgi:hypothetical protein
MTIVASSRIKASANATRPRYIMGFLTLVAGTATEALVAPDVFAASAQVFITRVTPGGTVGDLSAATNNAAQTITITSDNALDTSVVGYIVVW